MEKTIDERGVEKLWGKVKEYVEREGDSGSHTHDDRYYTEEEIDVKMKEQQNQIDIARNNTADAFDETKTYAVGNYCIYNNVLYKCKTAVTEAGPWNEDNWAITTVEAEISELNSNLTNHTHTSFDQLTVKKFYTPNCYIGNGSIELYGIEGSIPYIDFHHSEIESTNSDFTSRIAVDPDGNMSFYNGKNKSYGTLRLDDIYFSGAKVLLSSALGWSGWKTAYSNGNAFLKYAKCGGVVTVAGSSFGEVELQGGMTGFAICTLPAGYRPAFDISGAGTSRSTSGYEIQYTIGTDGIVSVTGLGSNAKYWGFTVSYPVGY